MIGRQRRGRQGYRQGQTVVVFIHQSLPVDGVGQEGSQGAVVKEITVSDVAADVHEVAAVDFPQLVVAAEFGIGIGHGVGADQTHIAELKFVTDLGGVLAFHQVDGRVGGSNLGLAAPPARIPDQMGAGDAFGEHVGARAQRMLIVHLGCLQNGDVQQHRQLFVGGGEEEVHAAVAGGLHTIQIIEEPALVVVIFPGLVVGRHHIIHGDGAAVGEVGVGIDVEGPGAVVRSDIVAVAQDGVGVGLAVHRKQTLVNQTHEHPVGVVTAEEGVHGPVGVIDQGQFLVILFGLQILRVLALHQQGIAGGHIAGVVDLPATAGKDAGDHSQRQKQRQKFFHNTASLQTMMAPWLPRSPPVTRWDQKRWG